MSIKYTVTTKTNVITLDDVNLTMYIDRNGEKFTVFDKIDDFLRLNNVTMMQYVAIGLLQLECATVSKDSELCKACAVLYKKTDDESIYIRMYTEDEAAERFRNDLHEEDHIDYFSTVLQLGKFKKDLSEFGSKEIKFSINEQLMSKVLVKKGLDSFAEFNRKAYMCELSID